MSQTIRDDIETALIACELKDEQVIYDGAVFIGALVEPPKMRYYKKQNMLTVSYPTKKDHMIAFNGDKTKIFVKLSFSVYLQRKVDDYDINHTKYKNYMKYDNALAYYVIVGDTMRFYLLLEDYGRKNRRHQGS